MIAAAAVGRTGQLIAVADHPRGTVVAGNGEGAMLTNETYAHQIYDGYRHAVNAEALQNA
ncbi:hypothetical protein D3C72_2355000 [compost metagenome]